VSKLAAEIGTLINPVSISRALQPQQKKPLEGAFLLVSFVWRFAVPGENFPRRALSRIPLHHAAFPHYVPLCLRVSRDNINCRCTRCNKEEVNGLQVLGAVIEDFMERILDMTDTWGTPNKWSEQWQGNRDKIHDALMCHGLTYSSGGKIYSVGSTGAVKSLEQILRSKDLQAAELEFERAMENISIDPPASLTAACAIIESACKLYIEDKGLPTPKECSIKPLWATVANDLGLVVSRNFRTFGSRQVASVLALP
jgi:hypothetical protein